ncbi:hypothetical protein PTTG_25763 [Puccinia triticina 1-1 BBBD Race 1]|uniref:Uncharacterized protein n=1 Tax=Puccinia triticina (isolate 1-1 / race 1 (BBBD)) TaxID=630390 RepID=A0A180GZ48_PUCT1|nr:hypothetical protein PTTG_25763 [Puccinia triticina 1-1 BBBD Race 1]
MIVANILYRNIGPTWFAIVWSVICLNSFSVVLTALQANSRTIFSFSRDGGLPDCGIFSRLSGQKVPVYAVWSVIVVSILMGLLKFASTVALNAVFSLCTIALDSSYAIPIAMKLIYSSSEKACVSGPAILPPELDFNFSHLTPGSRAPLGSKFDEESNGATLKSSKLAITKIAFAMNACSCMATAIQEAIQVAEVEFGAKSQVQKRKLSRNCCTWTILKYVIKTLLPLTAEGTRISSR